MVTTSDPESPPSVNINLRGRIYPVSCRTPSIPKPAPPTDVENEENERLRERIAAMLSFPWRSLDQFTGSAEVVRSFATDMVLLETMAQQWRRFLGTLKKSSIQTSFAKDVPKKEQVRAIDKALSLMGHQSGVMVDDDGVLNSELVEQPMAVVHQVLQATLSRTLDRFITVMRSDLEQLSDFRVVGVLEWGGATTCRFHFYEHDVRTKVDRRRQSERNFMAHREGHAPRMGREVLETLSGRHIHCIKRHEELLIEASKKCVADPDLVIPARVRRLIEQCPPWLRPELQIVEGEKCREECVELVRIESDWAVQWSKKRIVPHFDPALTLFNEFVLTGWDDQAHEREICERLEASSQGLRGCSQAAPVATFQTDPQPLIKWGILALALSTVVASVGPGGFAGTILIATSMYYLLANPVFQGLRIHGQIPNGEVRQRLALTLCLSLQTLGLGGGMLLADNTYNGFPCVVSLIVTVLLGISVSFPLYRLATSNNEGLSK